MSKRVLIVGAGGFVGGFLAKESMRRGYVTVAGIRSSTSRRFLSDPRLQFLELDYENPASMAQSLQTLEPFDWIVYNLGATKCANFTDFNRINFGYLRNFLEALRTSGRMPHKLLYMSSLSAVGPGDEKDYSPLTLKMLPEPNTRYGLSKIKAEMLLETSPDVPWLIFRPTGVYGPHEQDYLMMVKAMARGWDFGVGFRRQLLTFIYVEDLANAVFDALEKAPARHKYIISEERAYTQAEFREIVKRVLGKRVVVPVRLPLWMARIACAVSGKWASLKGRAATLNPDKYQILKQRNWSADVSEAQTDFSFATKVPLEEGIRRVVESWHKEEKK